MGCSKIWLELVGMALNRITFFIKIIGLENKYFSCFFRQAELSDEDSKQLQKLLHTGNPEDLLR